MGSFDALPLVELSQRMQAHAVSPVAVTDACVARIHAAEPGIHAYVRVLEDSAAAAARVAADELDGGKWRGPLHGVPVAVKDVFDLAGTPTTASSRVRADWLRNVDSAVVASLREAGAVIVGKTETHEFAYGGVTPASRNPWDVGRSPGGSSGGSAATVAAGGAWMATGTDTAGSIRIPAALCGIVGLKPTYGRVSRFGVTPLAWSLDHVGVLTRSVADAAASLQAIAGYDPRDVGSLPVAAPNFSAALGTGVAGVRVGVPDNYFFEHVDGEVLSAVRRACQRLESLGAVLVPVTIPMTAQFLGAEFAILMPEASAYHRRMLARTPDLYTREVRAQLEAGTRERAVDYVDAQRVRRMIQGAFQALFSKIDVLVGPTVPMTAPEPDAGVVEWSDGTVEPVALALVRLTVVADLTGQPALSIPCGFSRRGLPIGMQIIGRPRDEGTVLRIGDAYERSWPLDKPYPDPATLAHGA